MASQSQRRKLRKLKGGKVPQPCMLVQLPSSNSASPNPKATWNLYNSSQIQQNDAPSFGRAPQPSAKAGTASHQPVDPSSPKTVPVNTIELLRTLGLADNLESDPGPGKTIPPLTSPTDQLFRGRSRTRHYPVSRDRGNPPMCGREPYRPPLM